MGLTVSIAMTTYNGSKYIKKQMDSLRDQTRKVDEVIIMDDCSTDNTVELIRDYLLVNKLSNWTLIENESNKGWIMNFHQCISRTTGDYVFFCDQDDEWDSSKVQTMIDILEQKREIDVLACTVSYIDSDGKHLNVNRSVLPFGKNKHEDLYINKFNNRFPYTIMPGCTMVVRRQLIDMLEKLEKEHTIPHDALYWKFGSLLGKSYILNESLINYRIHSDNASEPKTKNEYTIKSVDKRVIEAKILKHQMQQIYVLYSNLDISCKKILYRLDKILDFTENRICFLHRKLSIYDISYTIKYLSFYRNTRMLIGDWMAKLRHNILGEIK